VRICILARLVQARHNPPSNPDISPKTKYLTQWVVQAYQRQILPIYWHYVFQINQPGFVIFHLWGNRVLPWSKPSICGALKQPWDVVDRCTRNDQSPKDMGMHPSFLCPLYNNSFHGEQNLPPISAANTFFRVGLPYIHIKDLNCWRTCPKIFLHNLGHPRALSYQAVLKEDAQEASTMKTIDCRGGLCISQSCNKTGLPLPSIRNAFPLSLLVNLECSLPSNSMNEAPWSQSRDAAGQN
jgi:hypothetical protein